MRHRTSRSSYSHSFLQRAPYPIGSRTGEHIGGAIPDLRDSVAFKRLDADSVAFRLSFPRDLRAGYTGKRAAAALTDTNIILAHQVAHSAPIILHEVWCTASPGDASMQRCMQSATAILASLGHKDAARMARLNPFLTFCWSIAGALVVDPQDFLSHTRAGRTLIRQKAIYDHHGDTANAARLARDIAAVIDAIAAISPGGLAASIAGSLRQLAGNSASSLPQFGTPVVPYDTCDPFAKPGPSVHDFPPPLYDPSPVQSATVSDRPTTPGVNASAFLLKYARSRFQLATELSRRVQHRARARRGQGHDRRRAPATSRALGRRLGLAVAADAGLRASAWRGCVDAASGGSRKGGGYMTRRSP
jgi:hypothetical protein